MAIRKTGQRPLPWRRLVQDFDIAGSVIYRLCFHNNLVLVVRIDDDDILRCNGKTFALYRGFLGMILGQSLWFLVGRGTTLAEKVVQGARLCCGLFAFLGHDSR